MFQNPVLRAAIECFTYYIKKGDVSLIHTPYIHDSYVASNVTQILVTDYYTGDFVSKIHYTDDTYYETLAKPVDFHQGSLLFLSYFCVL